MGVLDPVPGVFDPVWGVFDPVWGASFAPWGAATARETIARRATKRENMFWSQVGFWRTEG